VTKSEGAMLRTDRAKPGHDVFIDVVGTLVPPLVRADKR